uniref:C-type lectin domain-containing protein n=1 Tax=Chelonoidis abingdonii TaxID=106734 RepID=A0A8C0J2P9_CHEAB
MEDDEGYMVLNLRPTNGNSASPSPDGTTCYPSPAFSPSSNCANALQSQTADPCSPSLSFPLESSTSLMKSLLFCLFPDGSGCQVCPRYWLPHRDKCYWVSKDSKFWSESFKDCEKRTSQMLVIQDKEEMVKKRCWGFNFAWGGFVYEKKWTWVDTSPLDQSL